MRRVFVLLVAGMSAAGCGPAVVTVRGEVFVDDKPLDKGSISFAPAEGAGAPARAEVEKGRYELRTTPGKKWVQISAPVVLRKHKAYDGPDAPLVDVVGERLPERYNSNTELTYEVPAGGGTKDWRVEGKAR